MAHLQIPMVRYPRTMHVHGSGIQTGDSKETVSIEAQPGDVVVAEEKIDGANCGLSFHEDEDAQGWTMLGQSRGHYLDMSARGGRERQWNLYKDWAASVEDALLDRLETRYRLYAEWTSVAHTVFYDAYPEIAFSTERGSVRAQILS